MRETRVAIAGFGNVGRGVAEMLLSGEVLDGQTIHVSAGEDGLLVGNHVGRAGHKLGAVGEGPKEATLH